ncbi:MAG: hypothetical protein HMLKMBBP_03012 [Planctomycetes bacterium]|nr:hypothetical protein [Planctomycetota bacterium]
MGKRARRDSDSRGPAKVLFVFIAALLVLVGGATWLVLSDDEGGGGGAEATASGDPAAATQANEGPAAQGTGGTRKPKAAPPPMQIAGHGTVRGVVRFYKGRKPAAGLPLALRQGEAPAIAAVTDSDGQFRFEKVPAGGGYELRGESKGFAPIEVTGIDVAPDGTADLGTLWLAVPVDVLVEVVDPTGKGIADAEVSLFSSGREEAQNPAQNDWDDDAQLQRMLALTSTARPSKTSKTGGDGRTQVKGLMPGLWRVTATAKGRATVSRHGVLLLPDAAPQPVRLLLGAAHSLSGDVRDESDKPLAAVRVIAARGQSWNAPLDKWDAVTDEKGAYRIDGLPSGPMQIYLLRPGQPLLQVGQTAIPDNARFDIRLRPAGTIRGTVTSEDGKPVAGAEIRASMQQSWTPIGTTTDKDGKYVLANLPAGPIGYFRTSAPGFVPHPDPSQRSSGAGESLRSGAEMVRDVVLRRGLSAAVRVVNAADKSPVEGAEVTLRMPNQWGESPPWQAVSGKDGTAVLDGLLAGDYLLVVRAPGFVQPGMPPQWPNLLYSADAFPPQWRVTVLPGAEVSRTAEIEAGAVVTGKVVDASGAPVAGARVRIDMATGDPVFSAADGTFRVDSVPTLSRATASASAPGKGAGTSEPFAVKAGAPTENVEVKLAAGGKIRGSVRHRDGGSIEGAIVRWVAGQYDPDGGWTTTQFQGAEAHPVSAEGKFEIDGVPEGQITVRADADGLLPGTNNQVKVTPGQETAGIDLVLLPSFELRGRVEDQSGQPVADARISANFQGSPQARRWGFAPGLGGQPTAQSAADGTFVIRGLAEGNYGVWAWAQGFASSNSAQTATGSADIVLQLVRGKSISGIVKDQDGKPVAGIPVNPVWVGGATRPQGYWGGGMVYSGPDGTFEIQGLVEGTYNLQVSAAWQWARDVNVEDMTENAVSTGRTDVVLTVRPGQTVSGRLVDRDEKPVRSGWVYAQIEGGNDWSGQRWVQVSADGTFRISGLRGGAYTLTAWGSFRAEPMRGVGAGTQDVVIRTQPGWSISGQVFDEKGLSADSWFNVQMRRPGTQQWQDFNVAQPGDGRFIVTGLDEGAWDLLVQADGAAPIQVPAVAAGTKDLVVSARKGLSVSGFVVDAANAPIAGANVEVLQTGGMNEGTPPSNGWAQTDAEGKFKADGLADGEYRVVVRAGQRAAAVLRGVRAGASELKVVLVGGGKISGSVVDASGQPVQNARIQILTEDGIQIANARTTAEGTFEVQSVPEGEKLRLAGWTWANNQRTEIKHEPLLEAGATDVKVEVK